MTKEMYAALRALVELAQGYNATPEQTKQTADQFGVEVWQLEGYYFDEMELGGNQ